MFCGNRLDVIIVGGIKAISKISISKRRFFVRLLSATMSAKRLTSVRTRRTTALSGMSRRRHR